MKHASSRGSQNPVPVEQVPCEHRGCERTDAKPRLVRMTGMQTPPISLNWCDFHFEENTKPQYPPLWSVVR